MRQDCDTAAYMAGMQAVLDPTGDIGTDALRLARAYLLERSPTGSEEAMHVLWSFFRGVYAPRDTGDQRASA